MALFFIAFIGLSLFALFLMRLAQVPSSTLVAVLKWTSITILAVAFCLFVLSGRILYATILAVAVLCMVWRYKKRVHSKPTELLSSPDKK